jgi:proteasome lid subunit RPN8/RPN11
LPSPEVILQPGCFLGIIASAVEAYNRETNGFIMGTRRSRRDGNGGSVAVLESAYPIQTEMRMPSWVSHGNLSAFDRAKFTVRHLKVGLDLLGGYHSHTGSLGMASLSDMDLAYIKDEIHEMTRRGGNGHRETNWLEVVVAIRKKEFRNPRKLLWSWREYPKKIGCRVPLSEYKGFDATMGAYWVTALTDGNGQPPRVKKVNEATLRIPWSRRLS